VIAPVRLHRQALPIEAAGPVPAESFGLKRPVSVPAESERSEQPYKARFAAPHGVHTPRGEK